MAVYQHTYRSYDGPLTPGLWRFTALGSAALARLFRSRFLVLYLTMCVFYPVGCAALVYLSHNSPLIATLRLSRDIIPDVDGRFFYMFCVVQGSLVFLLTAWVTPDLIAPDLANGALPLFLSRPVSRWQYVLGKLMVLFGLQSVITWIPGLLVFAVQAGCAGQGWGRSHLSLAAALVEGLMLWMLLLGLASLALSAWVRRRVSAGGTILAVVFVGSGFGHMINVVLETRWGSLLNLLEVTRTIWNHLFSLPPRTGNLTVAEAWGVVGVVVALSIWALSRRIRGLEVVR